MDGRFLIQMVQHAEHVAHVSRELVAHGILEPVALPPADNIRAHDAQSPPLLGGSLHQRAGKNVEVPTLAGKTVRANYQMPRCIVPPLPPRHAVTISRIRAVDMMQGGFGHSLKQKRLPSWHRNSITEADSGGRTLPSPALRRDAEKSAGERNV